MKNKSLRVIELFSGIGSQAKALEKLGIDYEILNTCEWNLHSVVAYERIHMEPKVLDTKLSKEELVDKLIELGVSNDGKEPIAKHSLKGVTRDALNRIYSSIINTNNLIDISKVAGEDLPSNVDILTYSFPCQDLSNVGALHGYNKGIDRDAKSRSGLLWEVERILLERQSNGMDLPRFLLMENVPTLNAKRHIKNFDEWKKQLKELGYYNQPYVLNAKEFGLPQNRDRLLMISVYTGGDQDTERIVKEYFSEHNLSSSEYRKTLGIKKRSLKEFIKNDYGIEKYYKEALLCQPNDTESRRKIWNENLQITDDCGKIIADCVATITTKQDRHPNSGNLRVNFNNGKSNFRYLTPRECFMLMGFDESDFEKVIKDNFYVRSNAKIFTRDNLIKMAGNSIAVDVLYYVFREILNLRHILFI